MSKQITAPRPVLDLIATDAACCTPLTEAAISAEQATHLAAGFKALGDPVRLRLLSQIATAESGEVCVCDLTAGFELTGPTISHHLKVLREAGLIDCERRGTWVYYWAVPARMSALAQMLRPAGIGAR
ncbi:helix-turn-helix transcriptional regulator [Actinospica sp. MGRD01-02]|uniref:Helix-turn-helix transcriptional regulator n=1 Tax=Actinospica acidithermotolerans TaxID=2828514 RepID=A0A941IL47_9ACTN|nr:metalloregulator ArsR/SmtB family transcription factor [Actinospica acidithermotolerans]MBR7828703.1 helix-turn-helix transcriptional regulator [Actinospica acidithermotolerans]